MAYYSGFTVSYTLAVYINYNYDIHVLHVKKTTLLFIELLSLSHPSGP